MKNLMNYVPFVQGHQIHPIWFTKSTIHSNHGICLKTTSNKFDVHPNEEISELHTECVFGNLPLKGIPIFVIGLLIKLVGSKRVVRIRSS